MLFNYFFDYYSFLIYLLTFIHIPKWKSSLTIIWSQTFKTKIKCFPAVREVKQKEYESENRRSIQDPSLNKLLRKFVVHLWTSNNCYSGVNIILFWDVFPIHIHSFTISLWTDVTVVHLCLQTIILLFNVEYFFFHLKIIRQ